MTGRHRWAACLATTVLALGACTGATNGAKTGRASAGPRAVRHCGARRLVVVPPPRGRTYLGAFPVLGNTEDRVSATRIAAFEQLSGRRLGWVYLSDNWLHGIRCPAGGVAARAGSRSV